MYFPKRYVERVLDKRFDALQLLETKAVENNFSLHNVFYGNYFEWHLPFMNSAQVGLWYWDVDNEIMSPIGYSIYACWRLKSYVECGVLKLGNNFVLKANSTSDCRTLITCNESQIGALEHSKTSRFFLSGTAKFIRNDDTGCRGKIKNNYTFKNNHLGVYVESSRGVDHLRGEIALDSGPIVRFLSKHSDWYARKKSLYHDVWTNPSPFDWEPYPIAEPIMRSSDAIDAMPLISRLFILLLCCRSRLFWRQPSVRFK